MFNEIRDFWAQQRRVIEADRQRAGSLPRGVGHSEDFARVKALPVRQEAPAGIMEYFEGLLRRPEGTQRLRPIQAQALYEAGITGKAFLRAAVGEGKTLIALLLPRVVECERPLLIVPAALIEKTVRELKEYNKHWLVAGNLTIVSYQRLGRTQAADYFDRLRPDLIVCDEGAFLKNRRAAVTRRVHRYVHTHRPRFVVMGGTLLGKRMRNYAHMLEWTHGEGAPVPLKGDVIDEWCQVLDENRETSEDRSAIVGVLADLHPRAKPANEPDPVKSARVQYFARITDTPAVISSPPSTLYEGSLTIEQKDIRSKQNAASREHFQNLYNNAIATDGWPLCHAPEVWAVARQIALGICYVWAPRPPPEWVEARKRWAKFVRDTIARSHTLDSELAVSGAVDRGQLDDGDTLAVWREIRPTFHPNSEPRWHDDAALIACQEWMEAGPGIVWTDHNFFAEELSRRTGAPYFGQKGLTKSGLFIEDALAGSSVIASRQANSTGRNLQMKWSRNLVTAAMGDSDAWEQLLGRTHRAGQPEDGVTVDVLVGCDEHEDALRRALFSARQKQDAGERQKLLLADWV